MRCELTPFVPSEAEVRQRNLPMEEKTDIIGGNAARLFRLNRPEFAAAA